MSDKIIQKTDALQVPTGYVVSGGMMTTPAWMDSVTSWLDLLLILIGVVVGITTVWLNVKKIRELDIEVVRGLK